jgi:hypothetical protein
MNVKMFVTVLGKKQPSHRCNYVPWCLSHCDLESRNESQPDRRYNYALCRVLEYGNDNRNEANNSKGRKQKIYKANGGLK